MGPRMGTGRGRRRTQSQEQRVQELEDVTCVDWTDDMWDECYDLMYMPDDRDLRHYNHPRVLYKSEFWNTKQEDDYCRDNNIDRGDY